MNVCAQRMAVNNSGVYIALIANCDAQMFPFEEMENRTLQLEGNSFWMNP